MKFRNVLSAVALSVGVLALALVQAGGVVDAQTTIEDSINRSVIRDESITTSITTRIEDSVQNSSITDNSRSENITDSINRSNITINDNRRETNTETNQTLTLQLSDLELDYSSGWLGTKMGDMTDNRTYNDAIVKDDAFRNATGLNQANLVAGSANSVVQSAQAIYVEIDDVGITVSGGSKLF